MSLVTRTYTFANGGSADGGQVDSEVQNLVNTFNNLDTQVLTWTGLKIGTGDLIFSPTTRGIRGTTTNDNAIAGNIGEQIESDTVANNNLTPTATYVDIVNIALTAGDWDVSATAYIAGNGATWTAAEMIVSSTGGNSNAGTTIGVSRLLSSWVSSSATPTEVCMSIPSFRVSTSGSVTYYLKLDATFSGGGPPYSRGRISARRIR